MSLINDIRNLKAKVARKQKEKLLDKQVARKQQKQLFNSQIDDIIKLILDRVSAVNNQLNEVRENQPHRVLSNFLKQYKALHPNENLDMKSNNCSHNSNSGDNGDNDDKGRYNKNVEDPFNTGFYEYP